jgi:pimeloyl-ACP methyl ester carboxylesterase
VVARIALISVLLTLPSLAHAEDPCRPHERAGEAWRTSTGCLTVPWDDADESAGDFSLYFELSEPTTAAVGNLIVLHGGPAYPRRHLQERGPLWQGLRAHYRILYFHQRGSGHSARIASRNELSDREDLFTLAHTVTDAHHLQQELLGGEPVTLMGKSAGGFIAILFALRYPTETKRLILAATTAQHEYISRRHVVKENYLLSLEERYPGFLDEHERALAVLRPGFLSDVPAVKDLLLRVDILENVIFDLSYTLAGQFETVAITRDVADHRFDLLLKRVTAGRKTLRSTGMESLAVLNHITCREFAFSRSNPDACQLPELATLYDVREELASLAIPTLVLSGRFDPILPPRFQQEIAEAMGDQAQWHVLELSAHMLFMEQPRASAELVLDFLQINRQQPAQTPAL